MSNNKPEYAVMPTQFSIYRKPRNIATNNGGYQDYGGNPVFDCIKISLKDEAGGSYLKITNETEASEGDSVSFDWDEWDAVVGAVAKARKDWSYE